MIRTSLFLQWTNKFLNCCYSIFWNIYWGLSIFIAQKKISILSYYKVPIWILGSDAFSVTFVMIDFISAISPKLYEIEFYNVKRYNNKTYSRPGLYPYEARIMNNFPK